MQELPRFSVSSPASPASPHQSSGQLHMPYPDPPSSIGGRDNNSNSSLNDSPTFAAIPADDDANSPLFQSDDFRIWCMKVIPCTKRFVHDWTICPFAHAGEKAVRRDPRLYTYTGIACPDMKKTGACIRGDRCPYAHNVFEYWLHPTRYRTQLCNDGPLCKRGICFFAHSLDELRVPACKPYVSPEALARASLDAIQENPHPLSEQLAGPPPQQAAQAAALAVLNDSVAVDHSQKQYQFQQAPATGNIPRISKDYGDLPRWSDASTSWRVTASSPDDRHSFDYVGSMNLANSSARTSVDNSNNNNNTNTPYGSVSTGSLGHNGGSYMTNAFANNGQKQRRKGGSPLESAGSSRFPSGACTPKEQCYSNNQSQQQLGNVHFGDQSGSNGVPSEDELAQSLATLKIALTQRQVASAAAGSNHEIVISTLHQILKDAVSNQNNNNTSTDAEDVVGSDE